MNAPKKKSGRLLVWMILGASLAGNFCFGYRAISERTGSVPGNPVAAGGEGDMRRFDPALLRYSEVTVIPLCFRKAFGIATDRGDNMYVTGDGRVLVLDRGGKLRADLTTGETARCIAIDANGDLYLGMTGHIEVWDRKGSRKARWNDSGGNAMLTSIAVTDTRVYAADASNRVLRVYDKQGNEISRIGGKIPGGKNPGCVVPGRFFDVGIDPDGSVWLVNPGRHSLENYTADGNLRSSWGVYSPEFKDFCGCCNPSHIALMDDGRIITSEKGIPRIKEYDRLGNLESVVAGPDQFAGGTEGLDLAVDSKGRIVVLDPAKMAVRIFEKKRP